MLGFKKEAERYRERWRDIERDRTDRIRPTRKTDLKRKKPEVQLKQNNLCVTSGFKPRTAAS